MATQDIQLVALNSGEISRLALARVDLAKLRIACETESNFFPHLLGPAMFRPGTAYVAGVPGDAQAWLGEFYYSETQKTLLVLTATGLRFLVNDAFLGRTAVSAAVTNGDFTTNIVGWINSDEAGATSVGPGLFMDLKGTGTNYAWRDQQIAVTETGTEHALRLVVTNGVIALRVGTAQGLGDYLDLELFPGVYSLALTPTGNFWIRLGSRTIYTSLVDSINIEAAGPVVLPTPYTTKAHFDALRYDQSGDVLFVACAGIQQRRIERRAGNSRSWGFAKYQANDGPFRLGNVGSTTIAPSAFSGAVTLTASRDIFAPGHVGSIWKLTHSGQTAIATLGALNDVASNIRISGLAAQNGGASQRSFEIVIAAGLVGTVTLQKSLAAPGSWTDVESYTAATTKTFDDGLDNQIIYYQLKVTAYTSGSAGATLTYSGSSQTGICHIGGFVSSTVVVADVLQPFGNTTATSDWAEGEWSDYRGWPAAVQLHDGRLGWGQALKAQLSVSDAFDSFDDTVEGDSGPIDRTITTGGNDGIRWLLSLQRLMAATLAQVISIRASAFDQPLTPSAFTAKMCADDGAAAGVRPAKAGTAGIFAGAANRLYKLIFNVQGGDYESAPIDRLKPEMFAAGIADMAVQRKPDNCNIWVPLGDGNCAFVAFNQAEEVEALVSINTQGAFERVAVLPASSEDDVYFIVRRTIGGVTKRFIEKLAKRTEVQGGTLSKTMDAHIVYSGAPATAIGGLGHLEGMSVVAWADGAPVSGSFVVSGGAILLSVAASNVVVGLAYTGQIKTAQLAYAAEHGTALTMSKRVSRVGLVMADAAWAGIRIGRDFAAMTKLPATYRGRVLGAGEVLASYDDVPGPFNGGWSPDSRVCLQVSSPYCATVMGLALHMGTNEPIEPPPPAPRDAR